MTKSVISEQSCHPASIMNSLQLIFRHLIDLVLMALEDVEADVDGGGPDVKAYSHIASKAKVNDKVKVQSALSVHTDLLWAPRLRLAPRTRPT